MRNNILYKLVNKVCVHLHFYYTNISSKLRTKKFLDFQVLIFSFVFNRRMPITIPEYLNPLSMA